MTKKCQFFVSRTFKKRRNRASSRYTNEAQRSNTPEVMAVIAKCKRSNENYFMYHLVRTARLGAPTSTVVLDFRKTVISNDLMLVFNRRLLNVRYEELCSSIFFVFLTFLTVCGFNVVIICYQNQHLSI